MADASKHFLVRCRLCTRVFSLTALPMPLGEMAGIVDRARCPRCDAGADQLFMAGEADAVAWAQELEGAAG